MVDEQFFAFESREEISLKISAIDELISLQLNEILHHPEFKSLEATWRGLFYLIDQQKSVLRVKIKIFNARKSDLLKDFERALEIEQSAIYKKVFSDVYERDFEIPFGLLIGAYEFDHLVKDILVIEKMAEVSALAHAPFVAGVSPSMFYWESFEEIDGTRDMSRHCRMTQYNSWNGFRETVNARYVGLCMPHILLRELYKTDKNFVFRESEEKSDLLWGNAAFAFAGCAARAYDEKSWLGKMRGAGGDGAVEGLFADSSGNLLDANLERFLPEISELGFMALVDDVGVKPYFFNSQSTNKPRIYDSEESTSISRSWSQMENVLAVSRFAVNLMSLWQERSYIFNTRADKQYFLLNWLWRYYPDDDSPDEITAQRPLREFNLTLVEIPGKPGEYKGILFIRPTYLLDDMLLAMRVELYLPASGNS